jgi:hypothetical protein
MRSGFFSLRMFYSENRFPLFRNMRYGKDGLPNMYWQLRSAGSCAMTRS